MSARVFKKHICAWGISAVCALGFSAPAFSQCQTTYEIEILSAPCKDSGIGAGGIAENGDVAGSYSCSFGPAQPFAIFDDEFVTLPMVPGVSSMTAHDLNSFMEAAGSINGDGPQRAFRYSNGKSVELLALPGAFNAFALAVREIPDSPVAGYCTGGIPSTAVLWNQSTNPTPLNLPMTQSRARAMNDKGAVVGSMGDSTIFFHGFIWQDGKAIDIGLPPGCVSTSPTGINNNGVVCGWAVLEKPINGVDVRGWVWQEGKYTLIDPLPGYKRCRPRAVNNDGTIVGACEILITPTGNPDPAFIWKDGVMKSVRDVIPPDPTLLYVAAGAINNAGEIVVGAKLIGTAHSTTIVLHPIPPVPGDVNCDRIVDVDDLLAVINNWGGPPFTSGDLNQDGTVDMLDLALVLGNWTF